MSTPRVSVIVPVHNSERFLEQCLDSILAQTERDIEVICIDDGSTDSSGEILDRYAAEDNRVRVLHQKGSGAGAARNRGMDLARGTYLSFLDSDDFFEPEMLEVISDSLDEAHADIAVFGSWVYDSIRKTNRAATWNLKTENLPTHCPFSYRDMPDHIFNTFGNVAWNKLYRRRFVDRCHLRFQEISRANDQLFTCSSLILADSIIVVDKTFVHYRVATNSNLQSTNDRDPLSFTLAFEPLLQLIKSSDTYDMLQKSYDRWVLDDVTYNADKLHTKEALAALKSAVTDSIEPEVQLLETSKAAYLDTQQLAQYHDLCTCELVDYLLKRVQDILSTREDLYWLNDWREWRANVLQGEVDGLTEKNCLLSHQIEETRASASYRLGHSLLAPARIVRRIWSRARRAD